MLRHAIAPARSFAQIPNVILRHPRLSSDAKNLLNWQLSLPAGDTQCLSETARRAGIKKCAFQNAKRQLLDEGYLHEWRVRTEGGRFATVQLVSNTPLSSKEALAVRDGLRPAPGGARFSERANDDGRPSAAQPAPGAPTGPPAGRLPERNTGENTTRPTGPAPEPAGGPPESTTPDTEPGADRTEAPARNAERAPATHAAAEALLLSLGRFDPQLAMSPHTARRWAPFAAQWLESGLSKLRIRNALTEGLDSARKPLGALHWRLQHALPDATPPPQATAPAAPAPEPRVARMRECITRHEQPRLFTPPSRSDEKLCPDCRTIQVSPPSLEASSGYAVYAAARRAQESVPRPPRPDRATPSTVVTRSPLRQLVSSPDGRADWAKSPTGPTDGPAHGADKKMP
jgi:hypothetical protein